MPVFAQLVVHRLTGPFRRQIKKPRQASVETMKIADPNYSAVRLATG
jgi:hypothetical protein